MNNEDLNFLIITSFRYCLGRSTYVTSEFRNIITKYNKEISKQNRDLMIKEIQEAKENDNLGMRMDEENWKKVLYTLRDY